MVACSGWLPYVYCHGQGVSNIEMPDPRDRHAPGLPLFVHAGGIRGLKESAMKKMLTLTAIVLFWSVAVFAADSVEGVLKEQWQKLTAEKAKAEDVIKIYSEAVNAEDARMGWETQLQIAMQDEELATRTQLDRIDFEKAMLNISPREASEQKLQANSHLLQKLKDLAGTKPDFDRFMAVRDQKFQTAMKTYNDDNGAKLTIISEKDLKEAITQASKRTKQIDDNLFDLKLKIAEKLGKLPEWCTGQPIQQIK